MNKIYSAKQVIVTATPKGWDGPTLVLNDAAPTTGTFVEVAMAADETTVTAVMEGGGVINLMPGTNGTISVTLVSAGDQNGALSDARRYQKRTGEPRAWAVQVKDHLGGTIHSCPFAIIQGSPTATYSETAPSLTWVFVCPELDMDHQGSNNLGVSGSFTP